MSPCTFKNTINIINKYKKNKNSYNTVSNLAAKYTNNKIKEYPYHLFKGINTTHNFYLNKQ